MTFHSTRVIASATLLAALTLLSGCGGSGTGTQVKNPYMGVYAGVSTDSVGDLFKVNLSVNSVGAFTGVATKGAGTYTLSGTLGINGVATYTTSFTKGNFAGTFSTADATTVSAALSTADGSNSNYLVLVANPTAGLPDGNPYAGCFAGTIVDTTAKTTSPIAFTVDGSGNVSGSVLTYPSGQPTLATVAGTVNANNALSLTATANGVSIGTISGTVSLSGYNFSGSLTSSGGDKMTLSAASLPYQQ